VNAASFQRGPVAPGEIISIFAMGYGPANSPPTAFDARGHVDTILGGTRVLFDGVAAPMIFSSNRQINAIVPYDVAGKSTTQMQIEYGNSRSNLVSVPVAASAPGVFLANGRAIVLNQDGSLNGPQNPAAQGSIVVLFLTGEGQTNPPGENGKPALTVFPVPVLPVTVRIAGTAARLAYAGAAPLFTAGLMQINAEVPTGNSGTALLIVQVGQGSAPNSVIYVAPR
jgi:uncharacterized protein (TIGR03437 family)